MEIFDIIYFKESLGSFFLRPEGKIIGPEKYPLKGGWGMGGGVRKVLLTSRG